MTSLVAASVSLGLLVLPCQDDAAAPSFEGDWLTTFGEMRLEPDGDELAGTYSLGGRSEIRGTESGGRFEFRYTERTAKGEGWFELAPDGESFAGKWREKGDEHWLDWSGLRLKDRTNLDMESGSGSRGEPIGWAGSAYSGAAGKYRVEVDGDVAYEGSASCRIEHVGDWDPKDRSGKIAQAIPADLYRGQVLRLSGWLRTEAADGAGAGLWLRIDGPIPPGPAVLQLDEMDERRIVGEAGWTFCAIELPVPRRASGIAFGALLEGPGRAWFDSLSIEAVQTDSMVPDAARPLEARGLVNLLALAKLYGYVRHFHPSDEAMRADWDWVLVGAVRRVEEATSDAELIDALAQVFVPLAPTLTFDAPFEAPPELVASAKYTRRWHHQGYGQDVSRGYAGSYRSLRKRTRLRDPDAFDPEPARCELGRGLVAWVPLVVLTHRKGSLPRGDESGAQPTEAWLSLPDDRAARLAAVVMAWNALEHFHPMLDREDPAWERALAAALHAAAEIEDVDAFLLALDRLIAPAGDGGAYVRHALKTKTWYLPLRWRWFEDRLVVVAAEDDELVGAVVASIDGRPVLDCLVEQEDVLGRRGTAAATRSRAVRRLAIGAQDDSVRIEFEGDTPTVRSMKFRLSRPVVAEPRHDVIEALGDGTWYVDLCRADANAFTEALEDLASARSIVFDARGSLRLSTRDWTPHVIRGESADSSTWLIGEVDRPRDAEPEWLERHWSVDPREPYLDCPKVMLIDERAMGHSETQIDLFAGALARGEKGALVGRPTGGSNGNLVAIELPGGFVVQWTGMRVRTHAVGLIHGVGIPPDQRVVVRAEDLFDGKPGGRRVLRDPLLDRAVQVARELAAESDR